jgi:hypothetical protein
LRVNLPDADGKPHAELLASLVDVLTRHGRVIERSEFFRLDETPDGHHTAVLLTQVAPDGQLRRAVADWESSTDAAHPVRVLRVGFEI